MGANGDGDHEQDVEQHTVPGEVTMICAAHTSGQPTSKKNQLTSWLVV